MKMGSFDKKKSKNQAKQFLFKSINTLGTILDQDVKLINKDSINPYKIDNPFYYGFEILKNEIEAYHKL